MGVFGIRGGSDEGAAMVGLGEAGAGGGNSSGAQGVEGGRGVVWDHAALHKAKVVGEVGCDGSISRPIRLSSILRSGYLRRFGGGWRDVGMSA